MSDRSVLCEGSIHFSGGSNLAFQLPRRPTGERGGWDANSLMGMHKPTSLLCRELECWLAGTFRICLYLRGIGGKTISTYWRQKWRHRTYFVFICPKPHALKHKICMRQQAAAMYTESLAQKHQGPIRMLQKPVCGSGHRGEGIAAAPLNSASAIPNSIFPYSLKNVPAWSQTTSKKFLCAVDGG